MPKDPLIVGAATEAELVVIEQLARSLDLDLADLGPGQFIAARKNDQVIGFGRLRKYAECTEIATVGVIAREQKKGVGSMVVKELIRLGPPEIYVTCVIPDFFSKFGFEIVKQYPSVLQKKVDFCISYNFRPEEVFVMKFNK